jgi:hypothetical protein
LDLGLCSSLCLSLSHCTTVFAAIGPDIELWV